MICNFFLPFLRMTFYLIYYFFAEQSVLVNVVPHVYFCFQCQIQKIIAKTDIKSLPPMFSSRSFMISVFLIHLEWIFVFSFILLHIAVQSFHCCLLTRLSFAQQDDSFVIFLLFSHSVVCDSLWPHELQHTMLPCPSLFLRVCSNLCPLSQ